MSIKPYINSFLAHLYFSKINCIFLSPLSKDKPVFFLSLHRNGACDGWTHQYSFLKNKRNPTFIISVQLVKNFVGKMFFEGIAFVRKKDKGNREKNIQAMQQCVDHLLASKDLIIFPEGTSDLSCKPLPFKNGFARMIDSYLKNSEQIIVVPLGLEYTEPALMGSKVFVIYGKEIIFQKGQNQEEIFEKAKDALLNIAFITDTEEEQQEKRALANLASYESHISYYKALKFFEPSIPKDLLCNFRSYREKTKHFFLESHLAFYPLKWWQHYPLLYTPFVVLGFLLNAPCLLASCYVSKRFSDDENVISFWKILSATCLFYLYMPVVLGICFYFKSVALLGGYCFITYLYFCLYGTWKRAIKRLFNCLKGIKYRREFCQLHKETLNAFSE